MKVKGIEANCHGWLKSARTIVTDTTIAGFATNSGDYTLEEGDVILVHNPDMVIMYTYRGGLKTDVSNYGEVAKQALVPDNVKQTNLIFEFLLTYDLSLEWKDENCICASDFILSIADMQFIMKNNFSFEYWSDLYHKAIEGDGNFKELCEKKQ